MSAGIALRVGTATDTGRVRTVNEDTSLVEDGLFAVADGMGGHVAGEVASRVAIDSLRAHYGVEGLIEAVQIANRAVYDRATEDPALRGMGTTICAVALVERDGDAVLDVVNVGDSRVYVYRQGELVQLTEDHSLVGDLERDGRITPEEARVHPQRNVVTRSIGIEPEVEVDSFEIDPYRGDRVLLCSDGLFDMIEDTDILGVLRNQTDPEAAAERLVHLANEAGGRDNITVVLVDVVDDGGKAEDASASLAGTTVASRPVDRILADEPASAGSSEQVPSPPPVRRMTWRSTLFSLALLGVLAAAAGGTWWFARSGWFVGLDGERVSLFRGRPDGVLWFDPTVERRTNLRLDDLQPSRRATVEDKHQFTSREAAERFIRRVQSETTTTTIAGPGQTATTDAASPDDTVLPPTSAPPTTAAP